MCSDLRALASSPCPRLAWMQRHAPCARCTRQAKAEDPASSDIVAYLQVAPDILNALLPARVD